MNHRMTRKKKISARNKEERGIRTTNASDKEKDNGKETVRKLVRERQRRKEEERKRE